VSRYIHIYICTFMNIYIDRYLYDQLTLVYFNSLLYYHYSPVHILPVLLYYLGFGASWSVYMSFTFSPTFPLSKDLLTHSIFIT